MIGFLLLPLVLITLKFSRANLDFLSKAISSEPTSIVEPLANRLTFYFNMLWKSHLTFPVLTLCLISIPVSVYRKDRGTIMFFLWIAALYLLIVFLGWQESRYAIYWIPVFCFFAALTIDFYGYRPWKIIISTLLVVIAGYQFIVSFQTKPAYAIGYEEAAKYIIENKRGESVLYSGIYDTGYFIFFIRKHDADKDLIVLRADKILATSKMNWIVEERIGSREEIYKILENYGVRYVVIENTKAMSRSLEWLREEVKSDKFVLNKEIIIQASNPKINNVPLAIYEYKNYKPPKEEQILQMNIPLMGDSIEIKFKDLLHQE